MWKGLNLLFNLCQFFMQNSEFSLITSYRYEGDVLINYAFVWLRIFPNLKQSRTITGFLDSSFLCHNVINPRPGK